MSYQSIVLADGPKAYWHLDETSGTNAADSSGNSHPGTYVNSPTLNQTSLVPTGEGASVTFAGGSSQYVNCTGAQAYSTSGYSIEFWVKAPTGASPTVVYGEGNSGQGNTILQFTVPSAGHALGIFIRNDAGTTLLNASSVGSYFFNPVGSAVHVVFTDNNGAWKLYVNGTLDNSGTYTPSTLTTNTAAIGALIRSTTGSYITGTVDEVAVYSKVLSSTQVSNHYNATAGSVPANTVAPAVTGTAQVGSTLTTDNGTWTDDGSPTFTYQWQDSADGSTGWANIASATSSTYVIASGESTKYIRCNVQDTDANGSTTAASNVVGPVNSAAASDTARNSGSAAPFILFLGATV